MADITAGLSRAQERSLLDAEGIGGGACPEFPQGMAIALAQLRGMIGRTVRLDG
jgi:hypothetical protein